MDDDLGTVDATLFRVIVDAAAILEMDPEGAIRVVRSNPALSAALEREPQDLVGLLVDDLYDPDVLVLLRDRVRTVLADQRELRYEVTRERPMGTYAVYGTLVPLSPSRVLFVEHDHSTESSAFRELHALERLTETGTWLLNLATEELWRSAEFLRIIGVSADPQVKDDLFAPVHPDDRGSVRGVASEVIDTGHTAEVHARVVRPDGAVRHVVGRLSRADDPHGKPVRLYGTMQDVTERRAMEAGEAARERIAHQQARALQLNDDVIQSLARAWLALDLGRHDEALEAIDQSMATVRRIVSELLQATGELLGGGRALRPGDLAHMRAVRTTDADHR